MIRLHRLRVGCFVFLRGSFDGSLTRDLAKCWICYLESRSHSLVKIWLLTDYCIQLCPYISITLFFSSLSLFHYYFTTPRAALFGSYSSWVHISTLIILYLLQYLFSSKILSFRSIRCHGIQYWLGLRSSAYRCFAKRVTNEVSLVNSPPNHSRGWVESQFCYPNSHTVMSWYILSIC